MKECFVKSVKIAAISFVISLFFFFFNPLNVDAATTRQKEQLTQEIGQMLYNNDTTVHDMYSYRITYSDLQALFKSMSEGEYKYIIASYDYCLTLSCTSKYGYVNTVQMKFGGNDALSLYDTVKSSAENILNGIEPSMTDLDKIIYIHDAIVEQTTYKLNGTDHIYGVNGTLGEKEAVCMGYAKTLNFLLQQVGIKTSYVKETATINHGWTYVYLDGDWYHIDPTWDDTRTSSWGKTSHQFLLRNDDEFAVSGRNCHGNYSWTAIDTDQKSTSTKYSDWFVHDITGKMCFYDGYWYYVDNKTNNIMKAKSDGSEILIAVKSLSSGSLAISEIKDGILYFTRNKVAEKVALNSLSATLSTEIAANSTAKETAITTTTINSNTKLIDINDWKSGCYNYSTGKYEKNAHRICLSSLYEVHPNTEYSFEISHSDLNILIREMSSDNRMLKSHNLTSGQSIITNADCKYFAVSIYCPTKDSTITFNDFTKIFADDNFDFTISYPESKNESNAEATTVTTNPDSYWNDISYWRTGIYHWSTGKYTSYPSRICLNDYIECDSNKLLTAVIGDSSYSLLVRELDNKLSYISSTTLTDGQEFTTAANCAYLAISLYSPANDTKLSFKSYEALFDNGITIGLKGLASAIGEEDVSNATTATESTETDSIDISLIEAEELETDTSNDESDDSEVIVIEDQIENGDYSGEIIDDTNPIYTISWNDFSLWRSGLYHWVSGKYIEYPTRICLNNLESCGGNETFIGKISNDDYCLLIRELDSNNNFIVSHSINNGDLFTTSENCANLAVSLYCPSKDSKQSYDSFSTFFAGGVDIGLQKVLTIDDSEVPHVAFIQANNHNHYILPAIILAILLLGAKITHIYIKTKKSR